MFPKSGPELVPSYQKLSGKTFQNLVIYGNTQSDVTDFETVVLTKTAGIQYIQNRASIISCSKNKTHVLDTKRFLFTKHHVLAEVNFNYRKICNVGCFNIRIKNITVAEYQKISNTTSNSLLRKENSC